MTRANKIIALAGWICFCAVLSASEKKKDAANGSGEYTEYVPLFTLKDPHGNEISSETLYSKTGMLLMLTVPNLTQYEKQQRWEHSVEKEQWPSKNAPARVLLEDLSQQQSYRDKARSMMKESYKPGGDLTVVVDEDGGVRRRFGVLENETVILLVDCNGRIIHHESDDVEPDRDAARRLIRQVQKLSQTQANLSTDSSQTVIVAESEKK